MAGKLARDRRARGLRLNYPEAVALITSWVLEAARDGRSVAELMAGGQRVLGRDDVVDGVPEMITSVRAAGGPLGGDELVLDWRPEPTVICDGSELRSSMTVALRHGSRAMLREVVVLGRAGQRGGCFHGELTVEYNGVPLLAHTLLLDGVDPALAGPRWHGWRAHRREARGRGGGNRRPAEKRGEEPGLRWACSALDGPGWLLLVLSDRPTAVSALLDEAAAQSYCNGV